MPVFKRSSRKDLVIGGAILGLIVGLSFPEVVVEEAVLFGGIVGVFLPRKWEQV